MQTTKKKLSIALIVLIMAAALTVAAVFAAFSDSTDIDSDINTDGGVKVSISDLGVTNGDFTFTEKGDTYSKEIEVKNLSEYAVSYQIGLTVTSQNSAISLYADSILLYFDGEFLGVLGHLIKGGTGDIFVEVNNPLLGANYSTEGYNLRTHTISYEYHLGQLDINAGAIINVTTYIKAVQAKNNSEFLIADNEADLRQYFYTLNKIATSGVVKKRRIILTSDITFSSITNAELEVKHPFAIDLYGNTLNLGGKVLYLNDSTAASYGDYGIVDSYGAGTITNGEIKFYSEADYLTVDAEYSNLIMTIENENEQEQQQAVLSRIVKALSHYSTYGIEKPDLGNFNINVLDGIPAYIPYITATVSDTNLLSFSNGVVTVVSPIATETAKITFAFGGQTYSETYFANLKLWGTNDDSVIEMSLNTLFNTAYSLTPNTELVPYVLNKDIILPTALKGLDAEIEWRMEELGRTVLTLSYNEKTGLVYGEYKRPAFAVPFQITAHVVCNGKNYQFSYYIKAESMTAQEKLNEIISLNQSNYSFVIVGAEIPLIDVSLYTTKYGITAITEYKIEDTDVAKSFDIDTDKGIIMLIADCDANSSYLKVTATFAGEAQPVVGYIYLNIDVQFSSSIFNNVYVYLADQIRMAVLNTGLENAVADITLPNYYGPNSEYFIKYDLVAGGPNSVTGGEYTNRDDIFNYLGLINNVNERDQNNIPNYANATLTISRYNLPTVNSIFAIQYTVEHDKQVETRYIEIPIGGVIRNDSSGIEDTYLYHHVRRTIGVSEQVMTVEELENAVEDGTLDTLTFTNAGVKSIKGIGLLTNLKELNLSGNIIADLIPLKSLYNLEKLNLSNNNINNIDALAVLTGIKDLNISYNNISNIDALKYLYRLEILNLDGNGKLDDVTDLEYVSTLKTLHVYGTAATISDASTYIYLNIYNIWDAAAKIYYQSATASTNFATAAYADLRTASNVLAQITPAKQADNTIYLPYTTYCAGIEYQLFWQEVTATNIIKFGSDYAYIDQSVGNMDVQIICYVKVAGNIIAGIGRSFNLKALGSNEDVQFRDQAGNTSQLLAEVIPDPVLLNILLREFGVLRGDYRIDLIEYKSEVEADTRPALTLLELANLGVKDLTGLHYFNGLFTEIDLRGNNVSDSSINEELAVLDGITQLQIDKNEHTLEFLYKDGVANPEYVESLEYLYIYGIESIETTGEGGSKVPGTEENLYNFYVAVTAGEDGREIFIKYDHPINNWDPYKTILERATTQVQSIYVFEYLTKYQIPKYVTVDVYGDPQYVEVSILTTNSYVTVTTVNGSGGSATDLDAYYEIERKHFLGINSGGADRFFAINFQFNFNTYVLKKVVSYNIVLTRNVMIDYYDIDDPLYERYFVNTNDTLYGKIPINPSVAADKTTAETLAKQAGVLKTANIYDVVKDRALLAYLLARIVEEDKITIDGKEYYHLTRTHVSGGSATITPVHSGRNEGDLSGRGLTMFVDPIRPKITTFSSSYLTNLSTPTQYDWWNHLEKANGKYTRNDDLSYLRRLFIDVNFPLLVTLSFTNFNMVDMRAFEQLSNITSFTAYGNGTIYGDVIVDYYKTDANGNYLEFDDGKPVKHSCFTNMKSSLTSFKLYTFYTAINDFWFISEFEKVSTLTLYNNSAVSASTTYEYIRSAYSNLVYYWNVNNVAEADRIYTYNIESSTVLWEPMTGQQKQGEEITFYKDAAGTQGVFVKYFANEINYINELFGTGDTVTFYLPAKDINGDTLVWSVTATGIVNISATANGNGLYPVTVTRQPETSYFYFWVTCPNNKASNENIRYNRYCFILKGSNPTVASDNMKWEDFMLDDNQTLASPYFVYYVTTTMLRGTTHNYDSDYDGIFAKTDVKKLTSLNLTNNYTYASLGFSGDGTANGRTYPRDYNSSQRYHNSAIDDVRGIKNFTSVTDLRLNYHPVTDLSEIVYLTKLTRLELTKVGGTDILTYKGTDPDYIGKSVLCKMLSLKYLYIEGMHLDDYRVITERIGTYTAITDLRVRMYTASNVSNYSANAYDNGNNYYTMLRTHIGAMKTDGDYILYYYDGTVYSSQKGSVYKTAFTASGAALDTIDAIYAGIPTATYQTNPTVKTGKAIILGSTTPSERTLPFLINGSEISWATYMPVANTAGNIQITMGESGLVTGLSSAYTNGTPLVPLRATFVVNGLTVKADYFVNFTSASVLNSKYRVEVTKGEYYHYMTTNGGLTDADFPAEFPNVNANNYYELPAEYAIPDQTVRAFMFSNGYLTSANAFNPNKDDIITYAERCPATTGTFDASFVLPTITDISGVELFIRIRYLYIYSTSITEIPNLRWASNSTSIPAANRNSLQRAYLHYNNFLLDFSGLNFEATPNAYDGTAEFKACIRMITYIYLQGSYATQDNLESIIATENSLTTFSIIHLKIYNVDVFLKNVAYIKYTPSFQYINNYYFAQKMAELLMNTNIAKTINGNHSLLTRELKTTVSTWGYFRGDAISQLIDWGLPQGKEFNLDQEYTLPTTVTKFGKQYTLEYSVPVKASANLDKYDEFITITDGNKLTITGTDNLKRAVLVMHVMQGDVKVYTEHVYLYADVIITEDAKENLPRSIYTSNANGVPYVVDVDNTGNYVPLTDIFPDVNLRMRIITSIYKTTKNDTDDEGKITYAELNVLTSINLQYITNLNGLRYLQGLKTITGIYYLINDFSELGYMPNLQTITFNSGNSAYNSDNTLFTYDFSFLEKLPNLTSFTIYYNTTNFNFLYTNGVITSVASTYKPNSLVDAGYIRNAYAYARANGSLGTAASAVGAERDGYLSYSSSTDEINAALILSNVTSLLTAYLPDDETEIVTNLKFNFTNGEAAVTLPAYVTGVDEKDYEIEWLPYSVNCKVTNKNNMVITDDKYLDQAMFVARIKYNEGYYERMFVVSIP